MKSDVFLPDWASAPGDTIADILEERNIPIDDFAASLECTVDAADALLRGRKEVTISLARKLNQVLGPSTEFWMSRDFHYRRDMERLHGEGQDWLRDLPVVDMINFGWLNPIPHPSEELKACLRYFNVSTISEWHTKYRSLQEMATFRTSRSFDSRPASVAAWLRQGEIQAEAIPCDTWDPESFHSSLTDLRGLTRQKDPNRFIPELQGVCSQSGVAVVIIRPPNGCRASGATRFISPNKAILQLSSRHLTDDQFWFTFFHEAGHLLMHGQRTLFSDDLLETPAWIIEGLEETKSSREREANDFAGRILVPTNHMQQLRTTRTDPKSVIRFALRLGISPGVVVGQLQYSGRIGFNQMNRLKRRYRWEDCKLVSRERVQTP